MNLLPLKKPIPRDCFLKLFDVRDYVSNDTSKMIQMIKIISYSIAKQQFFFPISILATISPRYIFLLDKIKRTIIRGYVSSGLRFHQGSFSLIALCTPSTIKSVNDSWLCTLIVCFALVAVEFVKESVQFVLASLFHIIIIMFLNISCLFCLNVLFSLVPPPINYRSSFKNVLYELNLMYSTRM